MKNKYTKKSLDRLEQKLFNLLFINQANEEQTPTKEQVEKMMLLCLKRNNPSYYKLRHASGMSEDHSFKNINMYSDDGQKMRRFESGLELGIF